MEWLYFKLRIATQKYTPETQLLRLTFIPELFPSLVLPHQYRRQNYTSSSSNFEKNVFFVSQLNTNFVCRSKSRFWIILPLNNWRGSTSCKQFGEIFNISEQWGHLCAVPLLKIKIIQFLWELWNIINVNKSKRRSESTGLNGAKASCF